MINFKWKSIESFLLAFFVIRLYGIWFPPLETWHSWRQTLTAMIARNMGSEFSLLYPKVDTFGEKTGIIATEFPFYQSLIHFFNETFGYDHWYGRLISLFATTIASWCFFQLVKRFWNERTAWFSTVVFVCSLWFSFSRKIMPDTFAVSLVIIGIYFIVKYIDRAKFVSLILAFVFLTLGGLCKIPAVYLFGLYIPFLFNKQFQLNFRLIIGLVLLLSSSIILLWYFYWVPYLVNTYHIQLFFPKGITEGLKEIKPYWTDFYKQLYFGALRSYIVLLPIFIGFSVLIYLKKWQTLSCLGIVSFIFLTFAVKTGTVFPTHNYYVLPYSPVLALIAGIGLTQFNSKWAFILLIGICIEAIANQWSDFRIKDEKTYKTSLELQLNKVLPQSERIVIPTGANYEWMYWYNRKGWSVDADSLLNPDFLYRLKKKGAKFIVFDKHELNPKLTLPVIGESADCFVLKL